jgi:hypothetical protein
MQKSRDTLLLNPRPWNPIKSRDRLLARSVVQHTRHGRPAIRSLSTPAAIVTPTRSITGSRRRRMLAHRLVRCARLRCNGLQWKWVRTAINGNLGPDYMHLSIPSRRDSVQLRLLLSSWDCNQGDQDHIKCD